MTQSHKPGSAHPFGFADDEQAPLSVESGIDQASPSKSLRGRLTVGQGGRVLVPAEMRAALGVAEGDTLLATLEDGELRLTSVASAVARAQAIVRQFVPAGVSLVDELLAERRREVERENAKDGVEPRTRRS